MIPIDGGLAYTERATITDELASSSKSIRCPDNGDRDSLRKP